MSKRNNVLYMAVSPDIYELPMAVTNNLSELTKLTGIKEGCILSAISRNANGRVNGVKFVRIKIESEDKDEPTL